MSNTGTETTVSIALQPGGKQGDSVAFVPGDHEYWKIPTVTEGIDAIKNVNPFPQEQIGKLVPTGAFVDFIGGVGSISLIPRLEGTFGFILKAALGDASSSANTLWNGTVQAGVNAHVFTFDLSDHGNLPWFSARKYVPGNPGLGITAYDARINTLMIRVPNMGLISAQMQFMARRVLVNDGTGFTYENTGYESPNSAPTSGALEGFVLLDGDEYPFVGADITIVNVNTTPQEEVIIGSPYMHDITPKSRSVMVNLIYKWEENDLYNFLMNNAETYTGDTILPWTLEETLGVYPLEMFFASAQKIGATSVPYGLAFRGQRAVFSKPRELATMPGQIVLMQIQALFINPSDDVNDHYVQLILQNDHAGY